ncbi:hypothetical protein CEQ90_20425, partial [Lewinellaceae bacterium SD302]
MITGENKRKHLEMIQNIISRMSRNSFLIKGWTITIVSAVLVFLDKSREATNLDIALILPIIAFWLLDGFFLAQERSYIAKFNQVRLLTENEIDFDLAPLGGNFRKGLSAVF